MRKIFPLEVHGLKPPRVIESIKHDVRKYLKRERRKALPEDVDFWDFMTFIDVYGLTDTYPDWLPLGPMSLVLGAHTGPSMVGVAYAFEDVFSDIP